MAKLTGLTGIGGVRTPALGPGYRVSMWRGVPRIQAAVIVKRKKLSARQLQTMKEFSQLANVAKCVTPAEYDAAVRMAHGTQYLWRDLIYMAQAGRLFHFMDDTGKKWFSMAARTGISDVLDAISQIPGSILIRNGNWWDVLPPPLEGQVLGYDPDTGLPGWIEGGGGGGLTFWGGTADSYNVGTRNCKISRYKAVVPLRILALNICSNQAGAEQWRVDIWAENGNTFGAHLATSGNFTTGSETLKSYMIPLTAPLDLVAGQHICWSVTRLDGTSSSPMTLMVSTDRITGIPSGSDPVSGWTRNLNPQTGDTFDTSTEHFVFQGMGVLLSI